MDHSTLSLNIIDLQQKAKILFDNERYKQALVIYQQLWREDPSPVHKEFLIKNYIALAEDLVENEWSYSEAIGYWEEMYTLTKTPKQVDSYIYWLLEKKQHQKSVAMWVQHEFNIEDVETRKRLGIQVMEILLVKASEVIEVIPENHLLKVDLETAQNALAAYCQHNDNVMLNYLKKLSPKSPYLALSNVLKELVQKGNEIPGLRFEENADFLDWGMAIDFAKLPNKSLLTLFNKIGDFKQIIADYKGWTPKFLRLVNQLDLDNPEKSPKKLLDIIIKNRALLPPAVVSKAYRYLLVQHFSGMKIVEDTFGPLSSEEKIRITALHFEYDNNWPLALLEWKNYCETELDLEALRQIGNPILFLKRAIVLRKIAKIGEKIWRDKERVLALLIESLQYDPDHKPTWFKLLNLYQVMGENIQHNQYIEHLAERFPNDIDVKTLLMEREFLRGNFSNSINIAEQILKEYPKARCQRILILSQNVEVPSFIDLYTVVLQKTNNGCFSVYWREGSTVVKKLLEQTALSHISNFSIDTKMTVITYNTAPEFIEKVASICHYVPHEDAKKNIVMSYISKAKIAFKFKQYEKAKTYLNTASGVTKKRINDAAEIVINLGLLAFCSGDFIHAKKYFKKAMTILRPALKSQVFILFEAKKYELKSEELMQFLSMNAIILQKPSDVLKLSSIIEEVYEYGTQDIEETLDFLMPVLIEASSLLFSKTQVLQICSCFYKCRLFKALYSYTQEALKKWRADPLLTFYNMYGEFKGRLEKFSAKDQKHLSRLIIDDPDSYQNKEAITIILEFFGCIDSEALHLIQKPRNLDEEKSKLSMKTAYEILDIIEKKNDDEIKAAYLNEIQKYSNYPVNKEYYYKDIEAAFYAIETEYKRVEYQLFYMPIVTAVGLLEAAAPKITKLKRPSIETYKKHIKYSVDGDDEDVL